MKKDQIKPLYRKVNRKSSYQCHVIESKGGRFAWQRHSKAMRQFDGRYLPMRSATSSVTNGYDYTPLFRYLLSRVGDRWDEIYSAVKPRLNTTEPIWWVVSQDGYPQDGCGWVHIGEGACWSKLWIDAEGRLRKVDPMLSNISPDCSCHTHSFNGSRIGSLSTQRKGL
ncbi:hypothetical protein [uncultured Rikenella sp.]|uniref:hypothetical protein n=1 Tax=uncultured Rikenella sp. TaxID=368003 RepID=UPI00260D3D63|nr:hypothetical protein [uncultured Rikenella sp.]